MGSITLGELGPLTGPRADIGAAMVQGAKLALSVINANGGVLGYQVNLDPQDDASDPADAVPAVDKEIAVDHAVAIVGPIIQTAPVVLPLAAKANIPGNTTGDTSLVPGLTAEAKKLGMTIQRMSTWPTRRSPGCRRTSWCVAGWPTSRS
jgi:ABC-type branched-subunit amino acid transport system substrate-binding protein